MAKLLRSMPVKYNSLTFSLEQFVNMRDLNVDEVIGFLRVHEQMLQERESREEEQVLLARAFNQSKKSNRGSLTSGDHKVINFTRSRVETKFKLTNLMKISRIEGCNDK